MKLNRQIIYDNQATSEVFARAYVKKEQLQEDIERAEEAKFLRKNGEWLEGAEFENELEKMRIKLEMLNELFQGKICMKYKEWEV